SSAAIAAGTTVSFRATISDSSNPLSTPTGIISWSDNGAGGGFSLSSCYLTLGSCQTTYTEPFGTTGVTVTATYSGDTTHTGGSGNSILGHSTTSVVPTPIPVVPIPVVPTPIPVTPIPVTGTGIDVTTTSVTPSSAAIV